MLLARFSPLGLQPAFQHDLMLSMPEAFHKSISPPLARSVQAADMLSAPMTIVRINIRLPRHAAAADIALFHFLAQDIEQAYCFLIYYAASSGPTSPPHTRCGTSPRPSLRERQATASSPMI